MSPEYRFPNKQEQKRTFPQSETGMAGWLIHIGTEGTKNMIVYIIFINSIG